MKISLTEEIHKIKRLYTFKKGDTLLVEQGSKTKLPGPNYYEIQSFLEKKTGMDTGEPGFGNKTAEVLGIYLFGDNNTIKNKEDLSQELNGLGFNTEGSDFGENYAQSVSDIIRKVETNSMDVSKLLSNKSTKSIILKLINDAVTLKLPYGEKFKIKEIDTNSKMPDIIKNVDVSYTIEGIELKDYDLGWKNKHGGFKKHNNPFNPVLDMGNDEAAGTVWGKVNVGGIKFGLYGNVVLKININSGSYLDIKIKSIKLSTKYKYLDLLIDFGYQLKDNDVIIVLAVNLFPDIGVLDIGKGHTETRYKFNTPIEEEIKKIKIPTIDIGTKENQNTIRPSVNKKNNSKALNPLSRNRPNPLQHRLKSDLDK